MKASRGTRCILLCMGVVRVCLADDHRMLVQALTARLRAEPSMVVAGTACDRPTASRVVAAARPDVLVLGVGLGATGGVELIPLMLRDRPGLRVAMLGKDDDTDLVVAAVRAGARAWVSKTAAGAELVSAIHTVATGGAWFPPVLLTEVLDRLVRPHGRSREAVLAASLTPREREVLQCLVDGLARRRIAGELYLSENTVRAHTQNVLSKMHAHSRAEAVAIALRLGMRPRAQPSVRERR